MNIERFEIRTSSRRVFRRCLRKWGYSSSLRMNLQRRGAETNINFWFGTSIHFAMEDYFGWNKFGDPRRAFKAYYKAFKPEDRPEGADEHYELGLAMLTYFLEWYPKHNKAMNFQTLWLDENDKEAKPFSPGARPAVEEEFTLDLGYRVIIDAKSGVILKQFNPEEDQLYLKDSYQADWAVNEPVETTYTQTAEPSTEYVYLIKKSGIEGHIGSVEDILVRVVPIAYHGTMDKLVVDDHGRWWVLDYKTAKGADTAKLDTDDQISAYMWAAEQRFQHKIYGFIYLQLTKDVAKPPKRLKDGSLSVDKKQKTTYALFKKELLDEFGEVNKAPNKMIEMLNHLADQEYPEGDRFIRWDFITRNDTQKLATYDNIMAETKLMLDMSMRLFPNPTRDCGWDCPYREICIATDQGRLDDAKSMLENTFEVRDDTLEHNHDDWTKDIVWPKEPLDPLVIDAEEEELVPKNIFNIILPEKYLTDNYED